MDSTQAKSASDKVKAAYQGAYCYSDATESDPNERYLIMTHLDEVIGSGPTRSAAWEDAESELSLSSIGAL